MNEQDKQRAIRESRETIARVDELLGRAAAPEPRSETVNQRHRRELTERDEAWARERADEEQTLEARLMQLVDQRVEARVAEIEGKLVEIVKATARAIDGLANAVDELKALPAAKADAHVEATLARIEQAISELPRRARDADDLDRVLDLPSRRVN
jgi:hypothetical protein